MQLYYVPTDSYVVLLPLKTIVIIQFENEKLRCFLVEKILYIFVSCWSFWNFFFVSI